VRQFPLVRDGACPAGHPPCGPPGRIMIIMSWRDRRVEPGATGTFGHLGLEHVHHRVKRCRCPTEVRHLPGGGNQSRSNADARLSTAQVRVIRPAQTGLCVGARASAHGCRIAALALSGTVRHIRARQARRSADRSCRYGLAAFSAEQGNHFTPMPVVDGPPDVESQWCLAVDPRPAARQPFPSIPVRRPTG